MTALVGRVCVEELPSWADAAPVAFSGNYDRPVVGDVMQFSQEPDEAARECLFARARAITHQDQAGEPTIKDHERFVDAAQAQMTVTFEHGEVRQRHRKRFSGRWPASRQERPAVVPYHGLEDDDEADDSALLFASVRYLWLVVQECGDAKLGAEVLLAPDSQVVGAGLWRNGWRHQPRAVSFWTERRPWKNDPPIQC